MQPDWYVHHFTKERDYFIIYALLYPTDISTAFKYSLKEDQHLEYVFIAFDSW